MRSNLRHLLILFLPLLALGQPTVLPNRGPVPAGSQMLDNEQISVNAGSNQSVAALIVTNAVTVTGLSYYSVRWTKFAGPGTLTFSDTLSSFSTASSNVATASIAGTYDIQAMVRVGPYYRTDFKTVTFGGSSVNTPPTISTPSNVSGTEDGPINNIPFTVGDAQTSSALLSVSVSSSNPGLLPSGNITFGGSGASRSVNLSPLANAGGVATVTLTVTDAAGLTAQSSFQASWSAVNDAPTSTQIANSNMNEDASSSAQTTVSDVETPVGNLTVTASSSNTGLFSNASLTPTGSGAVRTIPLVPTAQQNGSATITYTVSDGQLTAVKSFTVTVNVVNDTPTISSIPDSAGSVGQAAVLNFSANDIENDGDSLVYTRTSSNIGAVPTANIVLGGSGANRTVTITGAAAGTSTITIRATDPGGLFVEDNFVFTVSAVVNSPPTITSISNQVTNEDTPTTAIAFTVNDAETLAASLTVSGFSSDSSAVSSFVFGGSGVNRTVTITPAANRNGTYTMNISVSDGSATASRSFFLDITAVNDAPTITQSPSQSTAEDTPKLVSFTVGDQETAAASLTLAKSSSNQTLVPDANIVLGGSGADRTATITPALDQTGSCTISIVVSDGSLTATNSFVISVTSGNDVPTITAITNQTINEDASTSALAFTVADAETAAGSLTVSASSSNASLIDTAGLQLGGSGGSRTLTCVPIANANGVSTVTVSVTDGIDSASTVFTLTVSAVNDTPTISQSGSQSTPENVAKAVTFGISDVETAAASLTMSGKSDNQTLVPDASIVFSGSGANRTATITPGSSQTGSCNIQLIVSDGSLTATNAFLLIVGAVNDPPTISSIANQTINEDVATSALAITISDPETTAANLTLSKNSSDVALVPLANITFGGSGGSRTVTILPGANQFGGPATITLSVSDGTNSVSTAFTVTVTSVNDTPTITSLSNQTVSEDTSTGALSFSVGDVETSAGTLTVSGGSSNLTLVPNANITFGGSGAARTVTVVPALNQSGSSTITVTVSDGSASAPSAFTLTVTAVNDSPTITSISNQTVSEDTPTAAIAFTISDVETAAGSLTVSANSSNPTLIPTANIAFGGSGGSRTVTLTPSANANGASTITISVSDGTSSATAQFTFTVNAVNDAPTISSIQNQSVAQGVSTGPLSFTVGDIETAAGSLIVSGASSNPTLVPTASIVFGGSGANRTVTVTPASGQSGSSVITVTVSDGSATATSPFTLTVGPGNTPPNVSDIANQTISQNGNTGALPFTVGDSETAPASLSISVTSSNPTLAPTANIVFGGSGSSRTVTVTPVANQTGTSTITVTVSDGNLTASDIFTVTVTGQNQPPVIATISNKTANENTPLDVPVSATDVDTATVTWSATSSDVAVVPNAGLTFLSGTAKANTLRITPAANQSGVVTVTVIANDGLPTLISNVKIWDSAPHNAFTGLEFFNGAWLCVFREATSHLSSDGNIRILRSTDGVTWASVGLLTPGVAGSDLRDPHLSIARNGQLRINADERIASPSSLKSVEYFSSNGTTWSGQSVVGSANDWLWIMGPGPDADYSISYSVANQPRLNLYRSTDGSSFSKVTAAAGIGLTSPYTSEADFVFRPGGQMVALLRGDDVTRAGVSASPYSSWTWTTLTTDFIGGPKLTLMPDGRIINASRITRFAAPAVCELSLVSPENGYIARYQTLSTSTDSGYCGVVNRDGYLWVSYYSSHEGKASIYFAKVRPNLPQGFLLTVNSQNDAPTITDITDKTTPQNTASGPHSFTVGDQETAAASLTLSGTSNNQTLVPNANIAFGGSGASRNVTVTPVSGQSGQATITVLVSDGTTSTPDTFVLTVTPSGGLEYHVTTGGASGNSGTQASPWNLDRARVRQSGKPESGSTVWIHAGRYSDNTGWGFSASGVTYRGYADEWPSIGADNIETDNSTIHPSADDITFFQLAINNLGRVHPSEGFYTSGDARRPKIIHCLFFNLGQCIAFQDNRDDGGGLEVYGSVLLFGGWNNSPTDAGGHNVYFQHKNMSDSLQFENNVSAYSFSKLLNCGGSEAAFNRNCLFYQNILLMDGGASQASADLQRPSEYIALVGNTPIQAFTYKDNFHYGGHLLFGYPDPQNIDLTVTGNYEFHQGYDNGTFSGMRFEKFNTLIITNNIVDASYEPTMAINNSGAVTRTINNNAYSGTLNFSPGGSFAGWQGNGYDANGSATTTHRNTPYIHYYRHTRYAHRHKAHVAIHNPQSTGTVNIDGAQAGLANNDQFVVLNAVHPDLTQPHAFRVVASGTYLGQPIAINMNSLTVAQPAGVSYSIPNCAPRAAALIVKKLN